MMMPAMTTPTPRPMLLVCQHCVTLIQPNEACSWAPLPADGLVISHGYTAAHDDCPELAFENWSQRRVHVSEGAACIAGTSLAIEEIALRVRRGEAEALLAEHGFLTPIDLQFAERYLGYKEPPP
jgi:uncharacterized protein (DUF433 family)